MDYATIDRIFPFVVFGYGAIMCFVLELPALARIGDARIAESLWSQMQRHRPLAYVCLFVGGLWSLQHLWF